MLGVRGRVAALACLVPLVGARAMPIVALHGGPLALELAGPESGDFSSGAALNLDLADVSMTEIGRAHV